MDAEEMKAKAVRELRNACLEYHLKHSNHVGGSKESAISACDEWDSPIHSIRHVVPCGENEWAFMGHINCETCKFCGWSIPVDGTRHFISVWVANDSDDAPSDKAECQQSGQTRH